VKKKPPVADQGQPDEGVARWRKPNAESVRQFQPRVAAFGNPGTAHRIFLMRNSVRSCVAVQGSQDRSQLFQSSDPIKATRHPRVSKPTLGWNLRTLSALPLGLQVMSSVFGN
jgi:hypothetical protein